MPSNLQVIAERLNISVATVSRAMNGKAGVSDRVRREVLRAAEELNIIVNPVANSRVATGALAIAFVIRRLPIPMVDDTFYNAMMKGAELELSRHGMHLVSITIDETAPLSLRFPSNLDRKRLDGLIVVGPELASATIRGLREIGVPLVLCANRDPAVELDSVTSANQEGAQMAVGHLIEHGHRRIACLAGPRHWLPVGDRVSGYLEVMRQHDLEPLVTCTSGLLTVDAGYELARQVLVDNPDITAIFAANDPLAVGALNAARDLGRKAPDNLALVGFDNVFWTESIDPPLTTVNIHKELIGTLAARRLLDLIQSGPQVPLDTRVQNELVIRQSCGCRPTAGREVRSGETTGESIIGERG